MPAASSPEPRRVDSFAPIAAARQAPLRTIIKMLMIVVGLACLLYWALRAPKVSWHVWLLPGLILSHLSFVCFALRFRSSLAAVGVRLGRMESVKLTAFASFCQFFAPLSVGADLAKFVLCQRTDPKPRAWRCATGIVLDHITGFAAALLVATLSCVAHPGLPLTRYTVSALVVAAILGGACVGVMRRAARRRQLIYAVLRRQWRRIIAGIGLSLLMQALLASAIFAGSVGWQLQLSYREILWVLACGSVLQLIPINVAGITAGDAAGAGLYVALGLPLPAALRLVALFYVYRISVAWIGGIWQVLPRPRVSVTTEYPSQSF